MSKYRASVWLAVLLVLAPSLASAQEVGTSEHGKDEFTADFPAGKLIRMQICSAGVTITGTDQAKILVHLAAPNSDDLEDVRVSLTQKGGVGRLDITGCPRNNFQIEIQVPKESSLYTRMFAGELEIQGIAGNKDLQIHAGDMSIRLDNPSDYGPIDLSVTSGDLEASAFAVSKGGLFRSWSRNTSRKYRLYAHVGAGDLTVR